MSNLGNPPGFPPGSDFAGATDLYPDLRMSSGRQALAEALLRRYLTQRGALWYDLDYGLGLTRFVNAQMAESSIGQLVEREALKDERVNDARAVVTREGVNLTIKLTVVDDAGPFTLTLAANEITVTLLGFSEAA